MVAGELHAAYLVTEEDAEWYDEDTILERVSDGLKAGPFEAQGPMVGGHDHLWHATVPNASVADSQGEQPVTLRAHDGELAEVLSLFFDDLVFEGGSVEAMITTATGLAVLIQGERSNQWHVASIEVHGG